VGSGPRDTFIEAQSLKFSEEKILAMIKKSEMGDENERGSWRNTKPKIQNH
jgi:hypothetical protein